MTLYTVIIKHILWINHSYYKNLYRIFKEKIFKEKNFKAKNIYIEFLKRKYSQFWKKNCHSVLHIKGIT